MDSLRILLTDSWPYALVGLGLAIALWLIFGKSARRRRAWQRGQRRLRRGQWREALALADQARALGSLSPAWQASLDQLAGEAQRQASGQFLIEREYEKSLEHLEQASRLLGLREEDARGHIVAAMLGEVRRLVAAQQTGPAQALIDRVLRLQPDCGEAAFWQAIGHLREGQPERARASLLAIQETGVFDPPFYLGLLDLRAGQANDALRRLGSAHRLDPHGPFINWQLGQAMIAAGSDPALALRALQRALGPKGLPSWAGRLDRAWAEGLPAPEKCYLRRLTEQHGFTCPLLGGDVAAMLRQARLALAQAHHRLGQFGAAADLARQLLGETAPTLPVLRTLGLALARQEQFDEAFKHLRAAFDLEDPKQPTTAGYLALCGALGKPVQVEDKVRNIVWAIGLLGQLTVTGDPDWAGIYARVLGEARSAGLLPAVADVRRAAAALTSVAAVDSLAAGVYDDLAELSAATPEHGWLYCRAVQAHGVRGRHDLALFGLALQDAAARDYFDRHDWDFEDVQCLYLIRWSETRPASFPPELGPEPAPLARRLLLARSRRLEEASQIADARTTAVALARLLPDDAAVLDRLACLHFRGGDADQAVVVLDDWQARQPGDHRPWLRRAILEQGRGQRPARTLAIQQALGLAKGLERARVAWLAAQLALADRDNDREALTYLGECLREQPAHGPALACLAALRWQAGERPGLADQSAAMRQPAGDAAFHYLAAVCHLQAKDYEAALAAAQQAASEPALIQEARCLLARAQLGLGAADSAVAHLKMVATDADCLSVDSARALLGGLRFQGGDCEDAVHWWQQVPASRRADWQLDEPLRAGMFLAGLTAYHQERFEESAQRLREAGRLGCRDRRLGGLIQRALFKAGQRLLFPPANHQDPAALAEKAAGLLEKCLQVGSKDLRTATLLALAFESQGKLSEARAALGTIKTPDAAALLRRGLLALKEGQLVMAEEDFGRAHALDPDCPAARHNLFMTRLSLGQLPAAAGLLPALAEQESASVWRHLLPLLGQDDFSLLGHPTLASLGPEEEGALLAFIRRIGHLEAAGKLLEAVRQARPESAAVRAAEFEVALLSARRQLLRCDGCAAESILAPWMRQRQVVPAPLLLMHNLLGVAACLNQDSGGGGQQFQAALRQAERDPRLRQNRALALEMAGDHIQAEGVWLRCIDLLEDRDGDRAMAIDAMLRLASAYCDRLNHAAALPLLERAHNLGPENVGVLDRLFQLYRQLDRADLARRTLLRLNELLPGDPNLDLYELELAPLRRGSDLESWINTLERIVTQYPRERRVQERAAVLLGTFVNLVRDLTRQASDQLARAARQVRSLRGDEVNWRAVHKVMRDLRHELGLLRHAVGRALVIDSHPEHLRQLRELIDSLENKLDETRRWQQQGVR